jgi:hypothetical protein
VCGVLRIAVTIEKPYPQLIPSGEAGLHRPISHERAILPSEIVSQFCEAKLRARTESFVAVGVKTMGSVSLLCIMCARGWLSTTFKECIAGGDLPGMKKNSAAGEGSLLRQVHENPYALYPLCKIPVPHNSTGPALYAYERTNTSPE